jgi:hypothetical protein
MGRVLRQAEQRRCGDSDSQRVMSENDLDDAYRFLIPIMSGRRLTADEDRRCRQALARVLRAGTPLDRGLRHMLAAVFDSDRAEPFLSGHPDEVAAGYAWLAGERVATLKFRSKTRRKSPLKDIFIASAIADRADRNISVEEATNNIAEVLGIKYETARKAWQAGSQAIGKAKAKR